MSHCVCARALNRFSCVRLFVTLWTVACQAPMSMGILQVRILEWVAMCLSRGSSQPRDRTCVSCVSCTGSGFFTTGATWEALSATLSLRNCVGFTLHSPRPDPPSPALLCGRATCPHGPPSLVVTECCIRGEAGGGAGNTHGTLRPSTCPTCWRLRLEVLSHAKSVVFRGKHLAFWQLHRSSHGCLRVSPVCLSHGLDIEQVPGIWTSQFLGMRNEEKLESVCMSEPLWNLWG